jgi:hypothetical protein
MLLGGQGLGHGHGLFILEVGHIINGRKPIVMRGAKIALKNCFSLIPD